MLKALIIHCATVVVFLSAARFGIAAEVVTPVNPDDLERKTATCEPQPACRIVMDDTTMPGSGSNGMKAQGFVQTNKSGDQGIRAQFGW